MKIKNNYIPFVERIELNERREKQGSYNPENKKINQKENKLKEPGKGGLIDILV